MGLFDWSKKSSTVEVVKSVAPASAPIVFELLNNSGNKINTETISGQIAAYNKCVPVSVIINKKAKAITNARFYVVDNKDNIVENRSTEIDAMKHPNQYQDLSKFISMVEAYISVFGKCYLFKDDLGSLGFELYVVPNNIIQANKNLSGSSLIYTNNITDYTVTIGGRSIKFSKDEIFEINDLTFGFDTLSDACSRLASLNEIINTHIASYEAVNELMHNRGPLGIISFDSGGDLAGSKILYKDEVEDIQSKLSRYGTLRDQFKYIIANRAASFVPVSSNITDLDLTNTSNNCIKEIARAYDISPLILDIETPKYENLKQAEIDMYDNVISADAKNIMDKLNKIYGYEQYRVMPFFDHLSIYQLAKQQQAQSMATLMIALDKAVAMGLMTIEEAKKEYNRFTT